MPGFGPAAELVAWRIPKGATFVVEGKGPKTTSARERPRWGYLRPMPNHDGEQLAPLKQVRQRAVFGQGLSRAQGRDSLQRRHSRQLLAGIHLSLDLFRRLLNYPLV